VLLVHRQKWLFESNFYRFLHLLIISTCLASCLYSFLLCLIFHVERHFIESTPLICLMFATIGIRTSTLMVRELPNHSNSQSWITLSNLGYGIGCGLFLPVLFADLFGFCFKKLFPVQVENVLILLFDKSRKRFSD